MFISPRSRKFGTSVAVTVMALASISVASAETVATVNGVAIDSTVLDLYISSRMQKPAADATPAERESALQELTDIYLLTTQPSAKALADDASVKAQIELQSRGILVQAVAADYLSRNPATDAEILAEYEKQMNLAPAQQFKARHILVETQAAASDLITQLDDGADFAELAKANSTGPTGPNGGDLGWFSPEQMVKPFSDAVAALENGAHTSAPVQTQFGWHVILREDSRDNQPPTLESVRPVIKQRIEQTRFQGYIEQLRSDHADNG
jgi:peptidyl-prolyl cis-trans isomerase C